MSTKDIPQKETFEVQHSTTTQDKHRHKPALPEREILRRLWRIYEMALAAAHRSEEKE
jgi:hypothetical protein